MKIEFAKISELIKKSRISFTLLQNELKLHTDKIYFIM
jgi:hypothetical protein